MMLFVLSELSDRMHEALHGDFAKRPVPAGTTESSLAA